jgi:pilus assembly protein Flp/PilA
MKEKIIWFTHEEDGQGMVEYGLILALIVMVVIGSLSFLGDTINRQLYENTISKITF